MSADSASSSSAANARRSFIGGLWHGAFLAVGMALTQPTTVLAAFIADLTGSTVWVGGLSTVLTAAMALPGLFAARYIEPRPRKMPFLLLAIYLRVVSWALLAWLVYTLGTSNPDLLAWLLVGLLAVFYAGGGLGGVPYNDIIGKVIPPQRRGAFFGGKEVLAGPLAVGAALLARQVLAETPYPDNYAILFALTAAAIAIASLGFWIIREPPRVDAPGKPQPWRDYWRQIVSTGGKLRALVIVELLTGFSLMAFPFYIVYARDQLGAPVEATGWFLLVQTLGGVTATAAWARLIDRVGSRAMLTACAATAAITPFLAIALSGWGWMGLLPVFFLMGASYNGRRMGFPAALLEVAPETERPTYTALNEALILPVAFLSLIAGLLLQTWSYAALFTLVGVVVSLGVVWARRLPAPTAAR